MIALDTNILVSARRKELLHFEPAQRLVQSLAQGDEPWALPWPCVYEFLRVVTHPRAFKTPTPMDVALEELRSLFDSPMLTLLGEGRGHPAHMERMIRGGGAVGNLAHDAHIATLCLEHGVREIWTTDRDLARFPGIAVRNPFDATSVSEPRARYRSAERILSRIGAARARGASTARGKRT